MERCDGQASLVMHIPHLGRRYCGRSCARSRPNRGHFVPRCARSPPKCPNPSSALRMQAGFQCFGQNASNRASVKAMTWVEPHRGPVRGVARSRGLRVRRNAVGFHGCAGPGRSDFKNDPAVPVSPAGHPAQRPPARRALRAMAPVLQSRKRGGEKERPWHRRPEVPPPAWPDAPRAVPSAAEPREESPGPVRWRGACCRNH
jgi:hypothetical protein